MFNHKHSEAIDMTAPANQELQHQQEPALGASSKACVLFQLGAVTVTAEAMGVVARSGEDFVALFSRHATGDYGDVLPEINQAAIRDGWRVMSTYRLAAGTVCVITEANRRCTTILLPCEY